MKSLGFLVLVACGVAHADGPRIGLEYESERDNKTGMMNAAVSVKPGWEFSGNSLINLVELIIDRNRDDLADGSGFRAGETKLFVRLRHNRKLSESLGYYLRGGVGRSINNQNNFNYAYIEPGLKYTFGQKWEWTLAIRKTDSIDGTDGQSVLKVIAGPSFSLDRQNEIELRVIRGDGDKDLTAWQVGYTYRF
jgi:hypothetical protein